MEKILFKFIFKKNLFCLRILGNSYIEKNLNSFVGLYINLL